MRFFCVVAIALAGAACDTFTEPADIPTHIMLEADDTSIEAGEVAEFNVQAQGNDLDLVVLDYGDGDQDSIPLGATILWQENRTHSFEEPGSYLVSATAHDADDGTARDTLRIEVAAVENP